MRRLSRWRRVAGMLSVVGMLLGLGASASAEQPATYEFWETWARTDLAVAEGVDSRTWIWGPEAISGPIAEPYWESPDGERLVQYFDKSRMEITNPFGDTDDPFYVTNGLLARELITGQLQWGDDHFDNYVAAEIPVAGDVNGPGPTYATMADLLYVPLGYPDELITRFLHADGTVSDYAEFGYYGVTDDYYVPETNHRVASVFWDFMHSDGPIFEDGRYWLWSLFENPFYATGLPITEAYWTQVPIAGEYHDVLLQCFERRCLTYTPYNPDGYQVEAGNIGLHYYIWRYGELPPYYQ